MSTELSIIIVNYNTFNYTCNCIASIYTTLQDVNFEIVLVDNASVECDAALFKQKFSTIKLITSTTNLGFAGGNNLGIKHSVGKYILLLNSDTELINNAPKICLDYLKLHSTVGMVAAQLIYPDGKIQFSTRKFRSIHWELLQIFPLYLLLPKKYKERLMLHHYFDHKSLMPYCDWVWGAFMLFDADIINKLPQKKLSEDFFMYCEDVLWCWEFKQLGYAIHYLPDAKVMHIHRGSTNLKKWKKVRKMSNTNHAQFMHKYYPNILWYVWAAIFFSKQWMAFIIIKVLKKYKL